MMHYVFNNHKPLVGKEDMFHNRRKLIIIHYCQHCYTKLVGEWWYSEQQKATVSERMKVYDFANLKHCLICGGEISEKPKHHFGNRIYDYIYENTNNFDDEKHLKREFSCDVPCVEKFDYKDLLHCADCKSLEPGDEIMTPYGPGVVRQNAFLYEKVDVAFYEEDDPQSIAEFLEYYYSKERYEKNSNKMDNFINECSLNCVDVSKRADAEGVDLKACLAQLVLIEKNIYSVSQRLKELYLLSDVADKDVLVSKTLVLMEGKEDTERALEEYETLESSAVENQIRWEDFPITYPQKPKRPEPPQKPELAVPGLFNKKRIMLENAALTEKYEKELNAYNVAFEKYQADLEKNKEMVVLLEQQRKNDYAAAIAKAKDVREKSISEAKAKYEELLKKQKEAEAAVDKMPTPEKAKYQLIKQETETAEGMLKSFCEVRNELYAYGNIFEKYRNFVAISSFYEYVSAGRCEILEGPAGAYNLFENEVRMNMVIGQLNHVIESLDEIKQNQYMIYSAIQETNSQLSRLNFAMNSVIGIVSSIKADTADMNSYMSKIAKNTEVIAYNTEVTAFYAKKNAELTNALGFMLALK